MITKENIQKELTNTNQSIQSIKQETYENTPEDKLINTMEFNNMKLKSLKSVRDTIEWILSDDNDTTYTEWSRKNSI